MLTIICILLFLYGVLYHRQLRGATFVLPIPAIIAGGVSLASAIGKGIKARQQRKRARDLKEDTYIPPELQMNRNLAQMQAYSRRAPGQAKAEESIRRAQANTLSAVQRTSGGDAARMAAASVASQGRATDALDQVNVRGQQFSEGAFGRMYGANQALAAQRRRNRDQFNQTKAELIAASDQNYFNAFSDVLNGGLAAASMMDPSSAGGGLGNPYKLSQRAMRRGSLGKMNQYDPAYQYYSRNGFGTLG
jgi:hypothetical protein